MRRASRVITRSTRRVASGPLTRYLKSGEMSISAAAWANGVVLVLVMRFVRADRVIARPFAVVQRLAQRERTLVKRRSNRHDTIIGTTAIRCARALRRDRHRRRPQRPDGRRLPRARGTQGTWCWSGATCSAAPLSRKKSSRGSSSPSAPYVVSLLRPEIIRELDLPRHGLEILPLDGTFTPMPERQPLVAGQRSREDPPGDRAAFPRRRRRVRRIRPRDGPDGAVRQADPRHAAAGSDVARSARVAKIAFSSPALPPPVNRRTSTTRSG